MGGLLDGLTLLAEFIMSIISLFFNNPMSLFLLTKIFKISKDERKHLLSFKLCSSSTKSKKVSNFLIEESTSRIEKTLNVSNFIIKHQMMWQYLKESLPKEKKMALRLENFFRLHMDDA